MIKVTNVLPLDVNIYQISTPLGTEFCALLLATMSRHIFHTTWSGQRGGRFPAHKLVTLSLALMAAHPKKSPKYKQMRECSEKYISATLSHLSMYT